MHAINTLRKEWPTLQEPVQTNSTHLQLQSNKENTKQTLTMKHRSVYSVNWVGMPEQKNNRFSLPNCRVGTKHDRCGGSTIPVPRRPEKQQEKSAFSSGRHSAATPSGRARDTCLPAAHCCHSVGNTYVKGDGIFLKGRSEMKIDSNSLLSLNSRSPI